MNLDISIIDAAEVILNGTLSGAQWHDRPTCPGLWACCIDEGSEYASVMNLSQDDIDRGAPFFTEAVFGPIPERPAKESK